ncbi:MAG TPA: DUF192 domain-containing protein [Acidimicrobiales bacterium]|jgi:uncharacterized membrane protein (UPF0127 family)|nr:DUF192 domain-containing protein [Acidimicrobiales bacterium]
MLDGQHVRHNQALFDHRALFIDYRPAGCFQVAENTAAQHKGLSGQTSPLPLVFNFGPGGTTPTFWMRNTPIGIVITWVAVDGHVLGQDAMAPESLTLHRPPQPVTLAVEWPVGQVPAESWTTMALGAKC